MPDETTKKTDAKKPADAQAVSLSGASTDAPMPGGWGGADRYVPSAAEVAEQKRIHEEVEKARGGNVS